MTHAEGTLDISIGWTWKGIGMLKKTWCFCYLYRNNMAKNSAKSFRNK